MRLLVLETIALGRADMVTRRLTPPYVVHLPPKRAARLRAELASIGVPFGIPLGVDVPEPRDDGEAWFYFGTVLGDVHVWGRIA